ncbi:hypothetical protein VNO78_21562 [Psophocarpus tetragonolobus]|uniref:Uncharacterized protein n=1 Tax=Psophocarpus tetragonolobus TaxID=3891 RepID=A0AAN9SFI4_PSOTE
MPNSVVSTFWKLARRCLPLGLIGPNEQISLTKTSSPNKGVNTSFLLTQRLHFSILEPAFSKCSCSSLCSDRKSHFNGLVDLSFFFKSYLAQDFLGWAFSQARRLALELARMGSLGSADELSLAESTES